MIKWVPDSEHWEGHVKYEDMSYPAKRRLQAEQGIEVNMNGEISINGKENMLLLSAVMYEITDKCVKELKLKHKDSGVEVKSLEELCKYQEGEELMIALGRTMLSGVRLGKD